MTRLLKTSLIPLVAALVLAGCASEPFTPAAAPAAPAAFKEDGAARFVDVGPAEAQPRGAWWTVFADPVLDDLILRATAGNTDVQQAAARVLAARALLRDAQAGLLPQVGASAGVSRATIQPGFGAAPGQAANLGTAGFNASWEPDFFGKLTKTKNAAALDAKSREAALQSARLVVQSDVAQAYFELRALDAERDIVRQTVAAYADTLHLTERRYQAGDVAELDLARVQAEVASTNSQALALDRERALREHALAVLLGELPTAFSLKEADWSGARLAWFPDVALTANGGYASTDLGDLFKWSARAWGVGALLSLPVFDGGRREAGIQTANAQWDIAAATYREQVLTAFRDVEDQLASLRLLADQAGAQKVAVDAASRATKLSDTRYRNGLVSQLELLDARRSELANRREAVQVRAAQYQATVGLIRALGGGWGAGAPAPTAAVGSASKPA